MRKWTEHKGAIREVEVWPPGPDGLYRGFDDLTGDALGVRCGGVFGPALEKLPESFHDSREELIAYLLKHNARRLQEYQSLKSWFEANVVAAYRRDQEELKTYPILLPDWIAEQQKYFDCCITRLMVWDCGLQRGEYIPQ